MPAVRRLGDAPRVIGEAGLRCYTEKRLRRKIRHEAWHKIVMLRKEVREGRSWLTTVLSRRMALFSHAPLAILRPSVVHEATSIQLEVGVR